MTGISKERRSPMSLLQLPIELRLLILRLCIGKHAFHISTTCSARCEGLLAGTSPSSMCQNCRAVTVHRLPGLTATCRQLFMEASPILYQNTAMVFASTRNMVEFFEDHPLALARVQRIALHCGPAKHASPFDKAQHRQAFSLLRQRAHQLRELHVSFRTYYHIYGDRDLLSNFWFHRLIELCGLSVFSLHIDLSLPGPVNYLLPEDWSLLQARVLCTRTVLENFIVHARTGSARSKTVTKLQQKIRRSTSHTVAFNDGRLSASSKHGA